MGACTVSFTIKGEATPAQVHAELETLRAEEAYQNGHQEGYSGDFQTIYDIRFPNKPVFESGNEAVEWCWNNCEKREALCVKYKTKDGSINTVVAGWGAC